MEKTEADRLVRKLLEKHLPAEFGIAPYEAALPLLPCAGQRRIPPGAASILCGLFPYYTGAWPQRNISRYAMVTDYHQTAGSILEGCCQALREQFPENRFEPFVDNSPIREVAAARLAGLGVVGQHGLLITPGYGCYTFIGEIVTDLVLCYDAPSEGECLNCGLCRRACPGGALEEGGRVQKERCRSHITQKKKALTPWEEEQIRQGGLCWGCDICTDVCPMNPKPPRLTPVAEFLASAVPVWDEETACRLLDSRAFNYRGEAGIRRNLALLSQGGPTETKEEG